MDQRYTLANYGALTRLDATLSGYESQYPYRIKEQATYTQHQITLYQANYCHTESEPSQEQPAVTGGALPVQVVLLASKGPF